MSASDSRPDVELDRVVAVLRSMPLTRLARHAGSARALAQDFADRAARLEGIQGYVVPDVGDAAVGDQVAVTGRDLLARDLLDDDAAWMAGRLRDLRLSL